MIDGYLRQGYNFCNLQGKKEKNVVVVIMLEQERSRLQYEPHFLNLRSLRTH